MKTKPSPLLFVLLAAGTLLVVPSARALDGTWIGNASGVQNWSTPGNWSGSNIADGIGSIANLTFDITAARSVTIDGTSRTVGILNIGDPSASPFAYTLAGSGGASLTMDNGGLQAQINLTAASNTISVPLSLTVGGLSIANTAGGPTAATISGGISSAAFSGTQV